MAKEIKELEKFVKFAAKELKLKVLPKIHFVGKSQNSKNAFGHSIGHEIHIRITDRHPNDIMRTIAHELFHFKQNLMGIRKSELTREDEANAIAGRIMRKYNTTFTTVFKLRPIPSNVAESESAVPVNQAGAGGIEGIGVGPKGEPGGKSHVMGLIRRKKLSTILKREEKEDR
jgi:hypothetical protein